MKLIKKLYEINKKVHIAKDRLAVQLYCADTRHVIHIFRFLVSINQRKWLLALANGLYIDEIYSSAAWIFGKLEDPYRQVCALLLDGDVKGALSCRNLKNSSDLDKICSFCLRSGEYRVGAKFILQGDKFFPAWFLGEVNPVTTPSVFLLLEGYLQKRNADNIDKTVLRDLVYCCLWRDRLGLYVDKSIEYCGATGLYGECLLSLNRYKGKGDLWRKILKGPIAQYKAKTKEGLVLSSYFLGKPYPNLCGIPINDENFILYFLCRQGWSDLRRFLETTLNFGYIQMRDDTLVFLGRIAEDRGEHSMAGYFYLLGNKPYLALNVLADHEAPILFGHAYAMLGKIEIARGFFAKARASPFRWRKHMLKKPAHSVKT